MTKIQIWRLLDLTSLNVSDTAADIKKLCQTAKILLDANDATTHVAAICCYPKFCELAKAELAGSGVKVATVVNFPSGAGAAANVVAEIKSTVADEIDVVFPYSKFLAGCDAECLEDLEQYRAACGTRLMKVILETAAFSDPKRLAEACKLAIAARADFLKTSTGKGPGGATAAALAILLQVIVNSKEADNFVGIKVSGGVKTLAIAEQFLQQIAGFFGENQIVRSRVRIGASGLSKEILN